MAQSVLIRWNLVLIRFNGVVLNMTDELYIYSVDLIDLICQPLLESTRLHTNRLENDRNRFIDLIQRSITERIVVAETH